MQNKKAVRIISVRKAVKPRDGVLWYGVAQSRSRGGRVNHGLIARKIGRKLVFGCSCEGALHTRSCAHMPAFAAKIRQRRAV